MASLAPVCTATGCVGGPGGVITCSSVLAGLDARWDRNATVKRYMVFGARSRTTHDVSRLL